jgi:sigma-B regulation protein RsbU (phosphoserine phosphatase)
MMDNGTFGVFSQALKRRKEALMNWIRAATPEEKATRLGPAPATAIGKHLDILDSAIARAAEGELGRCTVCNEFVEQHWIETDYTHSVCIDHLSGAERSRLESELELSQKVQKALLPHSVPELPGWEVAAFSRPASIVGGDYFDFTRFGNGYHALIIADVMGKGMPASMLIASLQASLRILTPEADSPSDVLSRINTIFCHNINLTKFVTLVIVELDPSSGMIRYASAGHNPPFILRGSQHARPEPLMPTGAAIGLMEGATFETKAAQLGVGDAIVMYTDGITEAGAHQECMFGEERLVRYLATNRNASAQSLIKDLLVAIQTHTQNAPPADDTTVIVVRRRG